MHRTIFQRSHIRIRRCYSRTTLLNTTQYQSLPFFQIDSFSSEPYGGNPAAVLLVPSNLSMDTATMLKVAEENNLSETCYVKVRSSNVKSDMPFQDHDSFDLKWFTPKNEVNLCGHGTLASAAALFQTGNKNTKITFHTLSGELVAKRSKKSHELIHLDFPLNTPVVISESHAHSAIIHSVANMMLDTTGGHLDIVRLAYCKVTKKLIIHTCSSSSGVPDIDALKALSVPPPDRVLALHDGSVVTGVSIVVKGNKPYDFCSRYFSPWNGIPEDPVNGSSHTVLAPYWMNEVILKAGETKRAMYARQASPRGGDIALDVDFEKKRVSMGGPASTAITGEIRVPLK